MATSERDTVELLLEAPELPPEESEALARDLEAVVNRYFPGRPLKLVSGTDEKGRRWLRVVVLLGPSGVR